MCGIDFDTQPADIKSRVIFRTDGINSTGMVVRGGACGDGCSAGSTDEADREKELH